MKKILTVLLVSVFTISMSCSQSPDTAALKNANLAKIEFEEMVHDFGTIKNGGDGTFEFIFKNTGKEPLIINNVKSSCGCTKPEWSAEPPPDRATQRRQAFCDPPFRHPPPRDSGRGLNWPR